MKRGLLALVLLVGLDVLPAMDSHAFDDVEARASKKACSDGPLVRPRAGCSPPALPSTGNPHQDCVVRINQLRWECQCLPPLERWKGGEKCAGKHAKHDSRSGIHAGFNQDICEPAGRAQNECPAWPSTTEVIDGCLQAMWDEGPGKRFAKHGHYTNMSNPTYEAVACGFAKGPGGGVWSVQNFR